MWCKILVISAGMLTAAPLSAQVFTTNFVYGTAQAIPDNNPVGLTLTHTVSGAPTSIGDLNVFLNITSQFNGDLYATLSHGSGFSVLLNRVGRRSGDSTGYGDQGFNVTLDDSASNGDIHVYRLTLNNSHTVGLEGALTGTWQPDARNVTPDSVLDTSTRSAFLSSFNGLSANGDWTLFIADESALQSSAVNSWGLEVSAVPEPEASAIVAGIVCLAIAAYVRRRGRNATAG